MIRPEVNQFIALGPLPPSTATVDAIARHEDALSRIAPPLSIEEAKALVKSFGPDDCFGLAWTLLHLIETAPSGAIEEEPDPGANEWVSRLWTRSNP